MAEPFLSEIRLFACNYAPQGWALCNGQLMPINQNQALFALLGTTYGGDGKVTFGLPDLRGRSPIHVGGAYALGQKSGEESHVLVAGELPAHTHVAQGSSATPNMASAAGNYWATQTSNAFAQTPNSSMNPASVTAVGGSQPHENRQPFLALNFCIALQGIFPSQN